jgi:hypothetical protein
MAAAIPYIVMAVASAAQYRSNQLQLQRQDRANAEGIRKQAANQEEANKRINKTLDKAQDSNLAGEQQSTQQQYLQQVQAAQAQANAGLTAKGLNADFDERAGGAAAQNADWGALGAKLLGTIDAGGRQRADEGKLYGDTNMDLTRIGMASAGDDFLTRLKMAAARGNTGLDLIAGIGGAVGKGMASNGYGQTTPATASAYGSYSPAYGG